MIESRLCQTPPSRHRFERRVPVVRVLYRLSAVCDRFNGVCVHVYHILQMLTQVCNLTYLSQSLCQIMRRCWESDPGIRPRCDDLVEATVALLSEAETRLDVNTRNSFLQGMHGMLACP